VSYYLSTNNTISTNDTHLRDATLIVARDAPDTVTLDVTIPDGVTLGTTYYLGVVIDPDEVTPELSEGNNTTYTAIRID